MVTPKRHDGLRENDGFGTRLPNLSRHRMSDPSSRFYGFDAIGVPVQNCQIETISQKWMVLEGKVLLNSRQVLREGL
jgi:hypothetical protein